ncbi:LPXTG cell wall anchor domain-containing protein [Aeromicrobium flavum]|uniref:LPXTG cell wall anchor domain-containing protein n=1 Tax=Aeromicrobium flavum TaxID=416568 RepID=UPI0011BE5469|nr:LPXTG cell wall anchor domain-containing protein [Aeromicrobium flavum]
MTVLTTGLLCGAVAPAAADDRIALSADGTVWADRLIEPLFDPSVVWVPGDTRTASFWVRNQAQSNASLTATVRSEDGDDLMSSRQVTLRARSGGPWVTLRNGTPSGGLTSVSIKPGSAVRVDVQAALDPAASNASQASSLDLGFDVRLAEAVDETANDTDGSDDESGSAGWLPDTGSGTPLILVWMAGIAMAVGAALAAAGRREKESEDV